VGWRPITESRLPPLQSLGKNAGISGVELKKGITLESGRSPGRDFATTVKGGTSKQKGVEKESGIDNVSRGRQ